MNHVLVQNDVNSVNACLSKLFKIKCVIFLMLFSLNASMLIFYKMVQKTFVCRRNREICYTNIRSKTFYFKK